MLLDHSVLLREAKKRETRRDEAAAALLAAREADEDNKRGKHTFNGNLNDALLEACNNEVTKRMQHEVAVVKQEVDDFTELDSSRIKEEMPDMTPSRNDLNDAFVYSEPDSITTVLNSNVPVQQAESMEIDENVESRSSSEPINNGHSLNHNFETDEDEVLNHQKQALEDEVEVPNKRARLEENIKLTVGEPVAMEGPVTVEDSVPVPEPVAVEGPGQMA